MIAVWILIGVAVGLIAGIIAGRKMQAGQASDLEATREKLHKETMEQLERRHEAAMAQMEKSNAAAAEQQERRHKEAMEALRRQFDETVNTMSARLSGITEKMLKERQTEFTQNSGDTLNKLLTPLQASIKEMRDAVKANSDKHADLGGRLDRGLLTLLEHTDKAQASAENLANALRGNFHIQGEWGETVLRELLESQGLKEGIHFHTQTALRDASGNTIVNSEGNTMRPDIVLHLDNKRDVIIDSKVSLSSYLEYVNAQDDADKKKALDAHIRSIENHVNELVRKDYSGYRAEGRASLGYMIMFVPNTTALLVATTHRPELWRNAMERKVYIADEQTLYAALKIVNLTWQQLEQAANHEKVYALAQEMLDRVAAFMKSYTEIGTRLEAARKSYDDGYAKLRDGGQSIPGTSRKLITLGAKYKKQVKGVDPALLGLEGAEE